MERYLPCPSCHALNRVAVSRLDQGPVCGKCKARLQAQPVFAVDRKGLEALLRASPIPLVLDVWAPWCGPCLRFAPTYEEYAAQHPDQALFLKLDSEAHQDAARSLRIQSIPTLLAFRQGKELARQSGMLSYAQLGEWLKARLALSQT
ncbi:MAG: thioredoxin domain-containing protein [Vulcanimicrobiota bacterium]